MDDYLASGERRKEAGSRKREEEEKVKGRKCRTTWLQGRGARKQEAGSRKQEEGRGGESERKDVQYYLTTGERRK